MELIRISNRKLKIMLTPTDMCHFELNADSFGEDSEQLHRSFRLLLDEIRKQTDFDADDRHLSVQFFPSRGGGCEMFISHLQNGRGDGRENTQAALLPISGEQTKLRPYQKNKGSFRKDCAYRFEALEHLLGACKRLQRVDCICESSAYRDEKSYYFLILTVCTASPFSTPEALDPICEYGTRENEAHLRLYIREHASLIVTPNAVTELGALA